MGEKHNGFRLFQGQISGGGIYSWKTLEQRVEDLENILSEIEALPVIQIYKNKKEEE